MYICEVISRYKNDFHFVSYCRYCESKERWGDGYANAHYQQEVFPNRFCPKCGKNEFGEERKRE